MAERTHHYRILNRWTGNLGAGTAGYRAYSRNFELEGPGKALAVLCSSDPDFRGDRTRYNTEELLVGCLSGCHMLWVLHLCAEAGITVTEYTDEATGEMAERSNGAGEFARVTLHPRMTITDPARVEEATALHHRAHELCFIARSVNFPVECEPVVKANETAP
jgi:organic hydroperoxide reductase OsmC/OhrA